MKARLEQLADELSDAHCLPLDLAVVCRQLGVGLRVAPADGQRRGALMRRGRSWEVVLMRRDVQPAAISAHERFTIAHELGHYVLLREAQFRPQRDAEYWLGERLCNHFASRLLIPPRILAGVAEPATAVELAGAVNEVATRAGVTAEPAARALVGCLATSVATGGFRIDAYASTQRLGFRGWWVENRDWWGGRGGRRLAVYTNHALAPVLETMRRMKSGQTAAPTVVGAESTFLRRRGGPHGSFAALLAR